MYQFDHHPYKMQFNLHNNNSNGAVCINVPGGDNLASPTAKFISPSPSFRSVGNGAGNSQFFFAPPPPPLPHSVQVGPGPMPKAHHHTWSGINNAGRQQHHQQHYPVGVNHFTVRFEVQKSPRFQGLESQEDDVDWTFFALKGVTLKETVKGVLERKSLTLEEVDVFLESSNTPLPLETDTSFFAGHKLNVRAKRDDSSNFKQPFTTVVNNRKNRQENSMTQDQADFQQQNQDHVVHQILPSQLASSAPPQPQRKESLPQYVKNGDRKLSFGVMNKKKFEKLASTFDQQQQQQHQNVGNDVVHHFADNVFVNENTGHRSSITVIPAQPCSSVNGAEQSRKERSRSQGRLSQIFPSNKAVERLEMLEKLTSFQENSLMTARLLLKDHPDAQYLCEESFRIEEHWQEIVGESEILNRKQQEQQDVLWELITTELNYIKQICSIVELKFNVENLQRDSNLLTDLECDKIFVNICDIGRANLLFWLQTLKPLVEEARRNSKIGGLALDPLKLEAGFENLHKLFEPYIDYCLMHFEALCYVRRKQKENDLFKEFTMWVQSRRFFGRLHLTDLLAKPMQRLTKYPLLLKAILKCTLDPAAKDSLNRMIDVAEEFASKVNFELCRKQHLDALRSIMQCMEYDAIETTNEELERFVKEKTCFDLTAPMLGCHTDLMRRLVLRGDLKLREAYLKVDVVCFLFTDLFMVCKMLGKKGEKHRFKVIRPLFHIDNVQVQPLKDSNGFAFVCLNEFRSPSMASIFVTHGADETVKWLEHIDMAKDEYFRLRNCKDYLTAMRGPGSKLTLESTFSPNNATPAMLGSFPASGANSRKSSTHLTPNFDAISMDSGIITGPPPSTYGSTLCQAPAPCRRTSIGPADNGGRLARSPMIDHRKCSSVDSSNHHSLVAPKAPSQTAVCAASLGMYTLGLIDPKNALSPLLSDKSSNGPSAMRRDSHSSSCLIDKVERKSGSTTPTDQMRRDSDVQRLKASSVEILRMESSSNPNSPPGYGAKSAVTSPDVQKGQGGESPREQLSRRLERRYFTADAIESMKPRVGPGSATGNGESGILKRFSWTTDPNNNQHYLKHKKFQTTRAGKVEGAGQCNIERSSSTNSNKGSSYCSSSGVSSSSLSNSVLKCSDDNDSCNPPLDDLSQDVNHSPTILEDEPTTTAIDEPIADDSPTTKSSLVVPKLDLNGQSIDDVQKPGHEGHHVSTVTIGGCSDVKEQDLIMAAHDMIKNTTISESPPSKIEKQSSPVKMPNAKSAKEQLLKFIMDTHLEASDV